MTICVCYNEQNTDRWGDDVVVIEYGKEHPDVVILSIATRPDCLSENCLMLLSDLRLRYPDKFIWVELGLQTIHEKTALFIRFSLNQMQDIYEPSLQP